MKADIHDKLSKPFKWLKEIGKQELINFATGEVDWTSEEELYENVGSEYYDDVVEILPKDQEKKEIGKDAGEIE